MRERGKASQTGELKAIHQWLLNLWVRGLAIGLPHPLMPRRRRQSRFGSNCRSGKVSIKSLTTLIDVPWTFDGGDRWHVQHAFEAPLSIRSLDDTVTAA